MNLKVVLIVSFLFSIECCLSDDRPEVKTKYGTYIGHIIKSRNGRELLAFQGIPFAKPPVDKLRFKEPVELDPDDGTYDALEATECTQVGMGTKPEDFMKTKNIIGTEDCLHLNIYAPKQRSAKELLPVYFWIHGGGFFGGSGSEEWNGPRFLLDENRDMVMVAINYRLGIFGFLSANDENLPGNLGLKDQTMALKWVKENIKAFGGDPNSITIGGLSAGAASVSHHLNSKSSRGLFHRAISQSGTADCSWALKSRKEARKIASNIIAYLGCPFEPVELLECLQTQPADVLINSMNVLQVDNTSLIMYLVPVVEKDSPTAFMTKESIQEGSTIPWLTGITNEEALIFFQMLGLSNQGYFDLSILKDKYNKLLPILGYYSGCPEANKITKKLKDYYFEDKEFSEDTAKYFVQLLSDRMFNHGLHKSTRRYKGELYMYMLSYKGKNSIAPLRPKGLENSVSHGDDIFYFFDATFGAPVKLSEDELNLSNTLLSMWYNFIKSGDPTPDTQIWEESNGGHKYLEFTKEEPIMKSDFFKERMNFLDKLDIRDSSKKHDEL